jgi:acyl carrier protein
MGLDVVEVVMQTEETFAIAIPNDEAEQARTVGDLYRIVLSKFDLPYLPAVEIEKSPPPLDANSPPWTTAKVWFTVKKVVVDQLQVDGDEVRESAAFQEDLGAD